MTSYVSYFSCIRFFWSGFSVRFFSKKPVQMFFLCLPICAAPTIPAINKNPVSSTAITYFRISDNATCFRFYMMQIRNSFVGLQSRIISPNNKAKYRWAYPYIGFQPLFFLFDVTLSRFSIITTKINSTIMAPA